MPILLTNNQHFKAISALKIAAQKLKTLPLERDNEGEIWAELEIIESKLNEAISELEK